MGLGRGKLKGERNSQVRVKVAESRELAVETGRTEWIRGVCRSRSCRDTRSRRRGRLMGRESRSASAFTPEHSGHVAI